MTLCDVAGDFEKVLMRRADGNSSLHRVLKELVQVLFIHYRKPSAVLGFPIDGLPVGAESRRESRAACNDTAICGPECHGSVVLNNRIGYAQIAAFVGKHVYILTE
jgi:hypothetical protein